MSSKLISCVGFAIRLARRHAADREAMDHLQKAMYHLKSSANESTQKSTEPEAKRRRTISLTDTLRLGPLVNQTSSPTEGRHVDERELQVLLAEMAEKNKDMVSRQISKFRAEFDELLARRAREHEVSIAVKDQQIARLQHQLEELVQEPAVWTAHGGWPGSTTPPAPDQTDHASAAFDDVSVACQFLTGSDLCRLALSSRVHFEQYHSMSMMPAPDAAFDEEWYSPGLG
eukprot:Skav201929  [mRNA]  locus=scaffold3992:328283:328972:+ [translate_table: standard]